MASKIVTKKTDTKTKEVKKNVKTVANTASCQKPEEHLAKANKAMSKAWTYIAQRSNKRG